MPAFHLWVIRAADSSEPMRALADALAADSSIRPSELLEVDASAAAELYRARVAQLRDLGWPISGDDDLLAALDELAPDARIWRAHVRQGDRTWVALFDLAGAPLACMTFTVDQSMGLKFAKTLRLGRKRDGEQ